RYKREFISNVTHELKTPLNAIIGFSQLISQNSSLGTEQKKQLASVNRNGRHLLALINEVLTMAKIEAGRTPLNEQATDIRHLMENLREMFASMAEAKGLKFEYFLAPDIPRFIKADSVKLRQVLINLVQNALKFTESGNIQVSVVKENEMSASLESHRVRFTIADTGCGIAADFLDYIFEAFVQGENKGKKLNGAGLGLSISRKYVQLMGGELTAESEISKGSVFSFEIPLVPAETAAEAAGDTHDRAASDYLEALPDKTGTAPNRLPAEQIAHVPENLLIEMENAARRAEMESLHALIAKIKAYDAHLAARFAGLADNFAYDKILQLIRADRQ
ncbi:MAG: sensor histidine kinase, partial [Desulfobacterales bacterium]